METLDYIRKINGIDKHKDLKQNEIDDMVEDYEHGKDMLITRFSVMINTSDALDVFINNNDEPIKAIVDEKKKYTATSNSEETIQVYPQLINTGDYVSFKKFHETKLNTYLITSEIKSNRDNYEGVILKCNQTFKWKDNYGVHEFQCYCKNDSYGVKDATGSDKLSFLETKLKIYLQYNEETKNIKENLRVVFNNRRQDIYKVISASTVINKNIIVITCSNDSYMPQYDDLENNLAYNDFENNDDKKQEEPSNPPKEPTIYEIIGLNKIKNLSNYEYTLSPSNSNCVWSLDQDSIDLDIAKIVSQTADKVTIYAEETMSEDVCILYAKDGDTLLAEKEITIVRK